MRTKYTNCQYLYSINGEGRYAAEDVKQLLGNHINVRSCSLYGYHGIRVAARKVWRLWENGEVIAKARKLPALADKSYYAANWLSTLHCCPERSERLKVDFYWEATDGSGESFECH